MRDAFFPATGATPSSTAGRSGRLPRRRGLSPGASPAAFAAGGGAEGFFSTAMTVSPVNALAEGRRLRRLGFLGPSGADSATAGRAPSIPVPVLIVIAMFPPTASVFRHVRRANAENLARLSRPFDAERNRRLTHCPSVCARPRPYGGKQPKWPKDGRPMSRRARIMTTGGSSSQAQPFPRRPSEESANPRTVRKTRSPEQGAMLLPRWP